jgi:hypothetical protein
VPGLAPCPRRAAEDSFRDVRRAEVDVLTIDLEDFAFEVKDGAIKHVGASGVAGTVKLYDVDSIDVREFGGERVKLTFEAEDDNSVEVALFPAALAELASELDELEPAEE